MENQQLEEAIRIAARHMLEKGRESMDKDALQGLLKELTLEEQVEFNIITNSNLVDVMEGLFAEMESVKKLALIAIVGSMSALALVGTAAFVRVSEIEEDNRRPVKREILNRIGHFEKYTPDLTVAEYDQKFKDAMTDLGYADKKWTRKFINKHYGKKVF